MICKKCGMNLPNGTLRCRRCNEPQTLEGMTAKELRAEASNEYVNGNYEEAVEILERASNMVSTDNPELAKDIRLHKGRALAKLGRWQEALQSYDQALIYGYSDFFTWYHRGEALFRLGRYQEALAAFNHALEIDPSDYLGLATAGKENTLHMLGR
jgi:tetratricopeptide (TPR) repeat protein